MKFYIQNFVRETSEFLYCYHMLGTGSKPRANIFPYCNIQFPKKKNLNAPDN
jgi:hypothetical protein